MILSNGQYRVTITGDGHCWNTPDIQKAYDITLNPEKIDHTDGLFDVTAICVERDRGSTKRIALLASRYTDKEHCAVLDDQVLTIIQSDTIMQIDLECECVLRNVACSNWGGLMEIHPIKEGYIIRGECDIFRYDTELNRVWHFSGRDIFVEPGEEKSFWIEDGFIHCRDWLGWHYVLDFDGNLISEKPEKSPAS